MNRRRTSLRRALSSVSPRLSCVSRDGCKRPDLYEQRLDLALSCSLDLAAKVCIMGSQIRPHKCTPCPFDRASLARIESSRIGLQLWHRGRLDRATDIRYACAAIWLQKQVHGSLDLVDNDNVWMRGYLNNRVHEHKYR